MLIACAMGLGTCWIGFAQGFLNTPEGKKALDLPAAVCRSRRSSSAIRETSRAGPAQGAGSSLDRLTISPFCLDSSMRIICSVKSRWSKSNVLVPDDRPLRRNDRAGSSHLFSPPCLDRSQCWQKEGFLPRATACSSLRSSSPVSSSTNSATSSWRGASDRDAGVILLPIGAWRSCRACHRNLRRNSRSRSRDRW